MVTMVALRSAAASVGPAAGRSARSLVAAAGSISSVPVVAAKKPSSSGSGDFAAGCLLQSARFLFDFVQILIG